MARYENIDDSEVRFDQFLNVPNVPKILPKKPS